MGGNFVTVPKRYADSEVHPSCIVTVDLDGNSKKNVYVLVPWKKIRRIVEDILDDCVDGLGAGGFETWGLKSTFDALANTTSDEADDVNNPVPAYVEQPDGSVDSVAIPPDNPDDVPGKTSNVF